MRRILRLVPHPANPSDAVSEVWANVRPSGRNILVSFCAIGRREEMVWPIALPPGFSDGLWRHSCFEAFFGVPGDPGYLELNMAPSRRWAAYRFDGYRQGMRRAEAAPALRLAWTRYFTHLMAWWRIPDLPIDANSQIGLSAVIETSGGALNYFALAHPPGNPDFHNRDCFIATLPPPDAP